MPFKGLPKGKLEEFNCSTIKISCSFESDGFFSGSCVGVEQPYSKKLYAFVVISSFVFAFIFVFAFMFVFVFVFVFVKFLCVDSTL